LWFRFSHPPRPDHFKISESGQSENSSLSRKFRPGVPIPHLLTKVFVSLKEFDPLTVAQAFYVAMQEHDLSLQQNDFQFEDETTPLGTSANDDFDTSSKQENDNESKTSTDPDLVEEETTFPKKKGKPKETSFNQKDLEAEQPNENQSRDISSKRFLPLFIHVLQFCYLCYKKKMPPVHYSVASTPSIDSWFNSLSVIKSNSNSFWYEKKLLHHHQLP
jgi:hypothetical protein